ncbi:MAG: S-layer homology domain-containing protein [Candidatus Peribacteraceae bacterium]|nr:S-layer homology domain-containing protein [Candidatus Peribacteraceae bacterium]
MPFFQHISATIILSIFVSIIPKVDAQNAPFPDMKDSWFRYIEAVEYLVGRNIINGYDDGTFKPDQAINRAEFLKIVFKGHNTIKPTRRCFSDINPDEWYAPYVCTAKNRGIVDGYPNGTFQPAQTINFAEAIKIVLGAYGREIEDGEGENWFLPYVNELDEKDILPSHSYIPWKQLTRERAADLIWRIVRYEEDRIVPNLSNGCGKSKPKEPNSVTVREEIRSFLLTVPENYEVSNPYSLIIAFHGRTNSNEQVRNYYGLDEEFNDAIIIYPAGRKNGNSSFTWADPEIGSLPDVKLFDEIVEKLSEAYCIDLDQIKVVGHSLGGWMSNSLACIRGDVIESSVSVGSSSINKECSGPAAALIVHNPNDNLAAFSGAKQTRIMRTEENSCSWNMQSEIDNLLCGKHTSCWGGNNVLWCPHEYNYDWKGNYYPHNWPPKMAEYIREFYEGL